YRAYGIGIHSNCKIAGLQSALSGPTFFTIQFETGPEPEWAKVARSTPVHVRSQLPANSDTVDPAFVLTEYGDGKHYSLEYSDGAQFMFDRIGERLWGATQPPLAEEDLASYFLGPVLGFLLRQRHITSLHASAVELQGRAVAFCGDAGFGKSTTAAALAIRGALVVSDDIVPMKSTNGSYWAVPGYPRLCVWPDAMEKVIGTEEELPKLSPRWEKRYIALDGVRAKFAEREKPFGIIYLFGERSADARAPYTEELRPREALLELVVNTYMNWLLDREERAREFDELCKLVQQVPVRRLVAHTNPKRIGMLCDRILEDLDRIVTKS
ncbi:MAG: hypothetical protein WBR26_25645, partial [Candidatus Acidiferrum sp.]